MALEDLTGTKYIDDLNSSNPAAGDNVSEGDDHIRGIKNVLKTTFPNIDGAVTATDTELNAVTTTANAALPKAGGAMTGAITTNSTFDGVDIATRDGVLTSTTTTANAALPKAGGAMTGDTTHADNSKDLYGAGDDLRIYHSGTHSFIHDSGTGDLILLGSRIKINNAANSEQIAAFTEDGSCDLFYNDSKKFETTSAGATVTGVLTATLQANAIDSDHYVDGSIDTAHINGNAVTGAKLALDYRNTSSSVDIYMGNNHDFVMADADVGLRFYTTDSEEMRLEDDGDLHVDGDVIAYSTTVSDATLKYNINPVEFALDKIKQLKGVTFNYLKGNKASAGLLAQDVEKVMPSAVSERKLPFHADDDKSYKTLHYDSMTAILVEAIKELTAKVEKLENK